MIRESGKSYASRAENNDYKHDQNLQLYHPIQFEYWWWKSDKDGHSFILEEKSSSDHTRLLSRVRELFYFSYYNKMIAHVFVLKKFKNTIKIVR